MTVSVIIPVYNEAKDIASALESILKQTKKNEIILVDDGSTDSTQEILKKYQEKNKNIFVFFQEHLGPAAARNLGAKNAHGEIFVFVDADMTFAKNFIDELILPIEKHVSKGTFSRNEQVANWDNVWARCWNYNQGLSDEKRLPENYPQTAPVFRALLASEFRKVKGYEEGVGWTDDWTLSSKLGYLATATNARCYHKNPSSLAEVFTQARWMGKSDYLSKTPIHIFLNLIRFSFPISFLVGTITSLQNKLPQFLVFKMLYDLGMSLGLLSAFGSGHRNK